MARVKNVVEKAVSMTGKIPREYQISVGQVMEFYNAFPEDCFSLIVNSFQFGYMQGVKAVKAKSKKEGK